MNTSIEFSMVHVYTPFKYLIVSFSLDAYENPVLKNGDALHTKAEKGEILTSLPSGTTTPISRSQTPELLVVSS